MSFYDNPNVTYNKWINWYHGVPETPPADDTTDEDATDDQAPADPVDVDFGQQETDVGEMDPAQEARVSASIMRIGDQRINGVVTKKGKNFGAIDFGTVKYASLDDYLKAEQLGDRSGRFSGVEFPNKDERDKTLERAAQVGAALDPTALMLSAIPFASAFDSQVIQDPTGQFTRAIPKSGLFNPIATMAIAEEYRELYALKEFRTKNPGVTGKEGGFAFNFGNVNIWRRPGEVRYRGQLSRAGLNQQTATAYEQFISGASQGKQVVSAMLASSEGDDGGTAGIINSVAPDARLVLQTENGGYLLNGNFHYGSGIARMGYMEDMEALASSVFSAGGKLSKQESMSIAQKWRSSAHGLDRNATTAEKLANLQTFIDAATTLNRNNEAAANAAAAAEQKYQQEKAAQEAAMEAYRDEQRQRDVDLRMYGAGGGDDDGARQARESRERARVERTAEALSRESKGGRRETFARGFNEGGEIPEDEDFVRGSPDTEQPMITGNELLEAAGDESGFVERPPSEVSDQKSVADDKPMVAKEEGMVLNAEAVKLAGEQDVAKMIKDAEDYVRSSGKEAGDDREATDIQISEGEVYISPQLADVIGRDRLRKINDRGIPKTEKKLQKAAKGGMIGYAEGTDESGIQLAMSMVPPEAGQLPDSFMDRPETADALRKTKEAESYPEATFPEMNDEIPQGFLDKLSGHWSQPVTRTRNVNFFKTLSDVELLTYMIMAETTTSNADPQDMYAVAQTAVNRMNNDDPNLGFRNQDTLQKVLLKQRPKGAFEYEGMDKSRGTDMRDEYNNTYDIFSRGAARAYAIATDILSGEMESSPAVPENVMWYEAPTQSGDSWMTRNLDFFDSYGGHNFYTARQ